MSDAISLLQSIDNSLKSIDNSLKTLVKARAATQPKAIATDRDLNGKYGDPVLKLMPRDWTGPSYRGAHLSECPPELLDLVAEMFDYFGRTADEKGEMTDKNKPVGDFKRADAARARGWAKRLRSGTVSNKATRGDSNGSTSAPEGWPEPDSWS